jgi:ABC-type nitrate/sulfonate/bicarbonate transport system ATPase subunit
VRLDVDIQSKAFESVSGKRHEVLSDICFSLAEGEVCVLIGPSGCGKSTLLRILAGLDPDFEGTVSRPPHLRIGMVFQEPRLLPWRTVEDNVRIAVQTIDEAGLSTLFAALDLSEHRSHFPGELSLGLARRVALARAFAIEPDILILDEPLASLDGALAARMRDAIADFAAKPSRMTLLVTHDFDDAVRLGDRLIILSERPARILHVVPIGTPRASRSEAEIATLESELTHLNLTGK